MEQLKEEHLNFTIKGRAKAINSIYRKMLKQNRAFEEVLNNYAIRIIYKSDAKNEKIHRLENHSIVTDLYHSNRKRMRDLDYQSLVHRLRKFTFDRFILTKNGLKFKFVERMDEIAEKRCCNHYKYKEGFKQKKRR